MKHPIRPRPLTNTLADGILQGDRLMLSRAITLIESNLDEDKNLSSEVLEKIIHATGNSIRVGITGVPGVGKSSFIEAIGQHIMSLGKKLAVLTIDPSSHISKGSILGDKTRMEHLSRNPLAFIRPSPSGKLLGGVTEKTHEVILLCEAAGYEVIIVETVGVGQSEVSVTNLVDFFLLLMLAGAGDEMQGIKRGITEIADAIVITKSDGENINSANLARATYEQSLHLNANTSSGWTPKVTTASALTGAGIKDVWEMILSYKEQTNLNGFFNHRRKMQTVSLFHQSFDGLLRTDIAKFKSLDAEKQKLEGLILDKKISAQRAAQELLQAYHQQIKNT